MQPPIQNAQPPPPGGVLSGANTVGMGRGLNRVQPAWMSRGSGQHEFIQMRDVTHRLKAASGKIVYFPDPTRCLTSASQTPAGSSFECWFCNQRGHIAYECPTLRGYQQAWQLGADGSVTAEGKRRRTELAHGPASAVGELAIAMRGRPNDVRPQLGPHRRLGNRDRLKNKRPTNLKRVFTPLPSCSVDTS